MAANELEEILFPAHSEYCNAAGTPQSWRDDSPYWYTVCDCPVKEAKQAILSLIESEKLKARIEELELVGKALDDDPELIRVWATHRIKELESKESAKREEKLYLTAEGMRAYDGSKWA